jgi:hypothetical protein
MRILYDGSVGIGTPTPDTNFLVTVAGNIGILGGAGGVALKTTDNDNVASLTLATGTEVTPGTGTGDLLLETGASTGAAGKIKLGVTSASELHLGRSAGKVGVFGAAPVVRTAAYTQTYATASGTVNPSSTSAFTGIDNTQVGTVYAQVADLNTLRTDLLAALQNVNQIIDDLQSYGWLQ